MRPSRYVYAPSVDLDGVCEAQAGTEDVPLVLDGALVSGGVATFAEEQYVTVTSAGDDTGTTFQVIGTDLYGHAVEDAIAGTAGAVTGTVLFKTVSSVTPDATTADDVTVGVRGPGVSPTVPINIGAPYSEISYGVTVVGLDGNVSWTLMVTTDDPSGSAVHWFDLSGGKIDNGVVFEEITPVAVRVIFDATSTNTFDVGTITFTVLQAGSGK